MGENQPLQAGSIGIISDSSSGVRDLWSIESICLTMESLSVQAGDKELEFRFATDKNTPKSESGFDARLPKAQNSE